MAGEAQGALSGAAGGAAEGATIGSVVPGAGTAIGAGVGAGVGAVAGFLSARSANRARALQQARIKYYSSPAYLMWVLGQIHPMFRAQVAATFGPQIQQALDKQAALLGPSGASTALTTASALAPDVAANSESLSAAQQIQQNAIAAATNNPQQPNVNPIVSALASGAAGYESAAAANRSRQEALLSRAVTVAGNTPGIPAPAPYIPPYLPSLPPGEEPNLIPGQPQSNATSPLLYHAV